jgi:putative DNA primase/helicase
MASNRGEPWRYAMSAAAFQVPDGCPDITTIATSLWGEITSKQGDELRFGRNASKQVKPKDNTWYDHEAATGGGYVDIYKLKYGEPPAKPKAKWNLGDPTAEWIYHDEFGNKVAKVLRYDPVGKPKEYRQQRYSFGKWVWKLSGFQIPLYRLPDLNKLPDGSTVLVVEGEKCAEAVRGLGFQATTNAGGAKKFRADHAQTLARFRCVIFPDADAAGEAHLHTVCGALHRAGCDAIHVVRLPGLATKGDVYDWIEAGGMREQLQALVHAAEPVDMEEMQQLAVASDADVDQIEMTEDGCALAFAEQHKDKLRYCHDGGRWYVWTNGYWQPNRTGKAFTWARELVRRQNRGLSSKVRAVTGKAAFAGAVERYAQRDEALAVTIDTWDADPWMLGTPGGVVDLRTGEMRPGRQDDFITKLTSVTPAAKGAECPLWRSFLQQATGKDQGLIDMLRLWSGYSLTGVTREHALLFIHGPGGNGKSVFINTLAWILGDYHRTAPMDTFVASQGDRHPTDLAMLTGARLVTASETEEGREWAESRINSVTGGDDITARFMRQDFFTYRPQFKLTIIGNHKPVLKNINDAAKRRFNIVPFVLKPEVPDRELENKLRGEAPAILRWMIDGCVMWQKTGLVRPEIVVSATKDYFEDQNVIGRWIAEHCVLEPSASSKLGDLSNACRQWASFEGEPVPPPGRVKGELERTLGVGFKTVRGDRRVTGIRLG